MKKIQLSVLLLLGLQLMSMHAAQELQQERQIFIDNAVCEFQYLTEAFDILHGQGIEDKNFHDYLEDIVPCQDKDINFCSFIAKAEHLVDGHMKNKCIDTIRHAIFTRKALDTYNHPLFTYIMAHKDNLMRDKFSLWVYQFSLIKNSSGKNALHFAAAWSNTEILNIIIQSIMYLDNKCKMSQNPLHIDYSLNHEQALPHCIDLQKYLDEKDDFGLTALHIAACMNDKDVVQFLINAGSHINTQDVDGNTALHHASCHQLSLKKFSEIVVHTRPDQNIANSYDRSRIYLRMYNKNFDTVYILIDAGADVSIKNNEKKLAKDIFKNTCKQNFESDHQKSVACIIS